MTGLRRLIVEIHRRSLWQVLAIFGATGGAVMQTIDILINRGILPEWVFTAGLVLLLIGLPVVLATAFVQEGVGTSPSGPAPAAGATDPNGMVADGVVATDAVPERHADPAGSAPAAHRRLLTWRNAIVGGLGAFALLGFASAGYMGMRTFGIGAPGTLLAQGVLAEGAPVLLADFESTADAELGDVVTRALLVDLLQSRTLRVQQRADVRAALERMQVDAGTRLTPSLALELAEREGYTAVITGDVATAGSGYVLTASVVGGPDFRVLAAFRETARGDAELVTAIERLSRAIRDKAGESLRSVRGGPSLAQVTTASLPALRAYTRAQDAQSAGDLRTALQEYERALALDSTFAMAHRRLSGTLYNLGIRPADARRAARRAWELSDRLPDLERLLAASFYHSRVSGDIDAEIHALEQALRIDSTDTAVRNSLGLAYRHVGRLSEAAQLYEGALRERPVASLWHNLAVARYELGDYAGAVRTADSVMSILPSHRPLSLQASFAFDRREYARADSLVGRLEKVAAVPSDRTLGHFLRYFLVAQRGRFREAERILDAPGAELFMADSANVAMLRAELRLLGGDTAGAIRLVRETASRHAAAADLDVGGLLFVAAEAGSAAAIAELLALWDSLVPRGERGFTGRVNTDLYRARLAHLRGDHESALATLQPLLGYASVATFVHHAMGRIHDDVQQPEAAIAAFRASLDAPRTGRIYDLAFAYTVRRLAELYDITGDTAQAIDFYARFVELWKDADPALQPRVRQAQQRIEWLADRRR
jgi:eukaryotic-like serine/threonine-protein kinase